MTNVLTISLLGLGTVGGKISVMLKDNQQKIEAVRGIIRGK